MRSRRKEVARRPRVVSKCRSSPKSHSRCTPASYRGGSSRWCSAVSLRSALKDRSEDTGRPSGHHRGWRLARRKFIELKRTPDARRWIRLSSVKRVVIRHSKPSRWTRARVWRTQASSGAASGVRSRVGRGRTPDVCCTHRGPPARRKVFSTPAVDYLCRRTSRPTGVFDLRDDDVFWCTAEVGRVTGTVRARAHSSGATCVVRRRAYDADGGRFWTICQNASHDICLRADAIRALMKLGDEDAGQVRSGGLR